MKNIDNYYLLIIIATAIRSDIDKGSVLTTISTVHEIIENTLVSAFTILLHLLGYLLNDRWIRLINQAVDVLKDIL